MSQRSVLHEPTLCSLWAHALPHISYFGIPSRKWVRFSRWSCVIFVEPGEVGYARFWTFLSILPRDTKGKASNLQAAKSFSARIVQEIRNVTSVTEWFDICKKDEVRKRTLASPSLESNNASSDQQSSSVMEPIKEAVLGWWIWTEPTWMSIFLYKTSTLICWLSYSFAPSWEVWPACRHRLGLE